jgi:hypothetical protein
MNRPNRFSLNAALSSLPHRFREPALNVLLVLTVLIMFVVGPLQDAGVGNQWIVNVSPILMGTISLFIVSSRGAPQYLALLGFGLSTVGLLLESTLRSPVPAALAATAAGLLFSSTIIWAVAHAIPRQGPITPSHIRAAATIYLNIAFVFTWLAQLLYRLIPNAYSNVDPEHALGELVYFSLSTLTCSGYGDILPIHPLTRSLAALEAVAGQLYVATIIGTLVGLSISFRLRQTRERPRAASPAASSSP